MPKTMIKGKGIRRTVHDVGDHSAGRHDAKVKLALHHLEALLAVLVFGHCMVDEQPRQIKKTREPSHHEHDMKRLYPEHIHRP